MMHDQDAEYQANQGMDARIGTRSGISSHRILDPVTQSQRRHQSMPSRDQAFGFPGS